MHIEEADIEQLKKQYGKIYQGSISFSDESATVHELQFVYRRPRVSDIERFQASIQKAPLSAQLGLLASIIVKPDSKDIVTQLEDYPLPVGSFIDTVITPFFGSSPAVSSKEL